MDGDKLGTEDGSTDNDGLDVGSAVVGFKVGLDVGFKVGLDVGSAVVGFKVGLDVGFKVGLDVGSAVVGFKVGLVVGANVVGDNVGGSLGGGAEME